MMKNRRVEKIRQGGISRNLIFTTLVTCFGSSMLYGYNLAVLNLPGKNVKCFLNHTILNLNCEDDISLNSTSNASTSTEGPAQTENSIDDNFLYGQVTSIYVLAGAIGAFLTGYIADFFGRRNGLMVNSVSVIIGGIICGPTVHANAPYLLYIGRFFIGLNCGVTVGLASIYLTEISPTKYRGAIAACHQLAVTFGIVMGNLLTLTSTLNTKELWPVAQALTSVPAVIGLCLLPLCPESPRYLFINKRNQKDALRAFNRVNKTDDQDKFINELNTEIEAANSRPKFKMSKFFTQRDLRMPLLIACLIQVMQQLSGINAVIGYSGTLLTTAGVDLKYAEYCVLGISVFNTACTIVSLPLIEKAGRRTLLLIPSAVLAVSLLVLTITVNLSNDPNNNKQILSVISVICVFTFIGGFALGLGPIPGFIVAEVTRQETRTAAYSISQALQWISTLIVMISYPSLNKAIGGFVFIVYLAFVVGCWIFFFLFMPETRGKTFDEVATDLAFAKIQFRSKTRTTILSGTSSNSNKSHDIPLKSMGAEDNLEDPIKEASDPLM